MRLEREITVAAPVGATWSALRDLARLAGYVPGARLEHSGDDNLYRGELRIDDAAEPAYEGTARLTDVDEDGLTAAIELRGRETGGPGTIAATIESRLEDAGDGGTRIVTTTDLRLTGRAARLGRDAIDQAAERLLRAMADGLEQDDTLEATPPTTAAEPAATTPAADAGRPPAAAPAPAAPTLSGAMARYAPAAGAGVLTLAALVAGRGRRRRRRIEISYRW